MKLNIYARPYVTSGLAAIARVNGGSASTLIAEGCDISGQSKKGFDEAINAAKAAETAVVMVMGLDTASVEKEGHDRTTLSLPGVQLELIKAVVDAVGGKVPVILVVLNGGAIALDWCKIPGNTDAIIEAFYPGKLGSEAISDAIFGAFSPGGKLPYTIMPEAYVDETDFLNMSMTAGPGRTYRYYTKTPLWNFGYGLSYSKFSLALKTQNKAMMYLPTAYNASPSFEITVKNLGAMAADEVVQAYFVPVNLTVRNPAPLPSKQLFDFMRVNLGKGQSTSVTFTVPSASLAVSDAEGNLVSAPGAYKLLFTNGVDQSVEQQLIITGTERILEAYPQASA